MSLILNNPTYGSSDWDQVIKQNNDAVVANLEAKDQTILDNKSEADELAKKNWIINGNFDFWQRGSSLVNPVFNTFLADRFGLKFSITTPPSNITHSRQILNADEIPGSTYYYRINVDGAGNVQPDDNYYLFHSLENGIKRLCKSNKSITISFLARSSILNKKLGIYTTRYYGSGGTPSATDIAGGDHVTLSSSWREYSVTFNMPSIAGKIFGTNNDDFLRLSIYYAYGLNVAPKISDTVAESFGGAGTIDIAQIKLEEGDRVTPFVPRDLAIEDVLCKRYYQEMRYIGTAINANFMPLYTNYPIQMRNFPTIKMVNASGVDSHSDRFTSGDVSLTGWAMGDWTNKNLGYLSTAGLLVTGSVYEGIFKLDSEIY